MNDINRIAITKLSNQYPTFHIDAEGCIRALPASSLTDAEVGYCVDRALRDLGHASLKEGWALFDTGGVYQIQKDDEVDIFATDEDALVAALAKLRTIYPWLPLTHSDPMAKV